MHGMIRRSSAGMHWRSRARAVDRGARGRAIGAMALDRGGRLEGWRASEPPGGASAVTCARFGHGLPRKGTRGHDATVFESAAMPTYRRGIQAFSDRAARAQCSVAFSISWRVVRCDRGRESRFRPRLNVALLSRPALPMTGSAGFRTSAISSCAAMAPEALYDAERAMRPAMSIAEFPSRVAVKRHVELEANLPTRWPCGVAARGRQAFRRTVIRRALRMPMNRGLPLLTENGGRSVPGRGPGAGGRILCYDWRQLPSAVQARRVTRIDMRIIDSHSTGAEIGFRADVQAEGLSARRRRTRAAATITWA